MTTPETEQCTTPVQESAKLPRRRGRLLRYLLMHLFPVTAGILLALLIDGMLELRRENRLVAQAHASIAAEIADNARSLNSALPSLDSFRAALNERLAAIDAILATGGAKHGAFTDYGLVQPSLNRTSWESAERTGALSYMDYAQVKEYAVLYAAQDLVLASHNELTRRFPSLGSIAQSLDIANPRARPDDLYRSRASILEYLVAIGAHRFMAHGLSKKYLSAPCYTEKCPQTAANPAP
jgi:hypothetical protein